MSSNEIAVKVENLSKCYNIYNQPQDRLKQSIFPRLQALTGGHQKNYFREFWALQNVSFEVKKGETIGIIGRNGSGKSTLLQLICGTLTPTTGNVEIKGRVAALLELGSGFNPEFTGRENVYLNGALLGLGREEINVRFDDIANFADIGDFIEQPVKMYSSGMVVRLAFAVQAMVDPDILIIDEALAVGDEKFQRKCFARLEELKSKGTSILFVSHSSHQIIEHCDRALLLEKGGQVMCEEPLQVVRAYQKMMYAPSEEKIVNKPGVTTEKLEGNGYENKNDEPELFYDPGLIPETTEHYPVQGAEILSFRILDGDGNVVNLLKQGLVYQFEMRGRFLSDREKIYIGLHMRAISGITLTGQRYPQVGKFIEHVQPDRKFQVTFKVKMILLPGVYFVGGGIWSDGEPSCLHRILDAIMFRVMPDSKISALGFFDSSSGEPYFEIA